MEGEVTVTMVEKITSALEVVGTLATEAVDFITNNEIAMILFASSLLGIGFGIFHKAKNAAN